MACSTIKRKKRRVPISDSWLAFRQRVAIVCAALVTNISLIEFVFVVVIRPTRFICESGKSFEGNSGSPVFNAETFEVEGILVNGQEDLVQDPKIECYRNIVYGGSGFEGVIRASELAPLLK